MNTQLIKALFFGFSVFLIPVLTYSQVSIIWEKSYGGTRSDVANSILATSDGGYIIAGSSQSSDGDVSINKGNYDYWIVKIDSVGNIEWEKSYGGSEADMAQSIVETDDNSYIIAGSTSSHHSGDVTGNPSITYMDSYWIVKLDFYGNRVWRKCFGGSVYDQAFGIIKDKHGDFVIAGTSSSTNGNVTDHYGFADIWLVKINTLGNIIWTKSYGGTSVEQARAIANTNNGYIITGSSSVVNGDVTTNYGNSDVWVVRTDFDGNIIWQKSYGGSEREIAYSITSDNKGNFFIAGTTKSNDGMITEYFGDTDFWIIKIDSLGELLWQKTIGGPSTEHPYSICVTDDGGCIAVGYTSVYSNFIVQNKNYLIVKLDKDGSVCWTDTLGGSDYDVATSIINLGNHHFLVAGYSSSNDGDVSGHHPSSCGSLPDYWIVKFNDISEQNEMDTIDNEHFAIFPNPTDRFLYVNITEEISTLVFEVFDIMGQRMYSKHSTTSLFIDLYNYPNGIYLLKVSGKNFTFTKKIIKQE
jgi:hypothetical protein